MNEFRLGNRFDKYKFIGIFAASLIIYMFYLVYDFLLAPVFPFLKGTLLIVFFIALEVTLIYGVNFFSRYMKEHYYYIVTEDKLILVSGSNQFEYWWKDFESVNEEKFDFTSICPIVYQVDGKKLSLNQYIDNLWGLNKIIIKHIEDHVEIDSKLKELVIDMA